MRNNNLVLAVIAFLHFAKYHYNLQAQINVNLNLMRFQRGDNLLNVFVIVSESIECIESI